MLVPLGQGAEAVHRAVRGHLAVEVPAEAVGVVEGHTNRLHRVFLPVLVPAVSGPSPSTVSVSVHVPAKLFHPLRVKKIPADQ